MLNKLKKSNSEGFTIIEVMIVLAIAGVILLVVLLAVPALQRNSRNTTMKNDANAAASAVTEYASNNSGALPLALSNPGTGSWNICDAATCTTAVSNFKTQGSTVVHLEAAAATPTAANYDVGNVDIDTKESCTNTTGAAVTSNVRATAILYTIETGNGKQINCVSS